MLGQGRSQLIERGKNRRGKKKRGNGLFILFWACMIKIYEYGCESPQAIIALDVNLYVLNMFV